MTDDIGTLLKLPTSDINALRARSFIKRHSKHNKSVNKNIKWRYLSIKVLFYHTFAYFLNR